MKPKTPCGWAVELLAHSAGLTAFNPADGLLLFNPAQLTLGNEPPLAAHRAEDATLDDLLAEALEQLVLRLVLAENNTGHEQSPPFWCKMLGGGGGRRKKRLAPGNMQPREKDGLAKNPRPGKMPIHLQMCSRKETEWNRPTLVTMDYTRILKNCQLIRRRGGIVIFYH